LARLEKVWHCGSGMMLILTAGAILGVSWLWLRAVKRLKNRMPAAEIPEMEENDEQQL